ncbi:hypothetical protein [Cetobacterium somerae]|uniref:hypothetical protein n=1 Tax=Cetobacterium somerae TaxID=188913 RepID=UPI0038920FB9
MLKFIQKTALLSLLLLLISANTTFASEPPANIKAILHDNTPLNPAKVLIMYIVLELKVLLLGQ